jgi:pimeloyl-ACP methyl ester carboxylesterase/DNA-binding CsgD family transcriptional regulator
MPDVDQTFKSEIIDHLYDVALDPARYEALLDAWEKRVAPLRIEADRGKHAIAREVTDPDLEAHVQRASIFLDRYREEEAVDWHSVLELEVAAAFLVCHELEITGANKTATEVLGIAAGMPLSRLHLTGDDLAGLRTAVQSACARQQPKPVLLRFFSPDSERPMVFHVSQIAGAAGKGALALVRTSELGWPDNLSSMIRDAFQLTNTEIDIVRALAEGKSLKEIAAERQRSFETIRSQLRSILAKTETRSQNELIRITLSLMEVVSTANTGGPDKPVAAGSLQPLLFKTMIMPDGRRYDFIEYGAKNGRPVLFLPMDYGLIRWPYSAERAAERLNIRVISPVRAGFGHSSQLPKNVDYAGETASDLNNLLEHLGLARVAVIALGADLRYAMRLAITQPRKVTGILGCSAALPTMTATQYERMDKWQRFILANARYAPKILPFLVKAGFSLARRVGTVNFFNSVNAGSPGDIETFADPEVREAMLMGAEICLSDWHIAHEAFARECIDSEVNWAATVRACKTPVRLLQGAEDPQSPTETVRELMAEFPHLDVDIIEGIGQLLFFKEWRRVLVELERFLPEAGKAERARIAAA